MPKPTVDEKLLLQVAKNSRLNLSKSEAERFLPQLQEILEAFSKLDKVDVSGEKPSFQPLAMKNIFREDKVEESLLQEQALSNAKHKKDGYFKGPKVA